MEMKINSALIKAERERRVWSQEHLASVAGLGVRTIQRIESTGVSSAESLKALSSVLEISTDQLQVSAITSRQKLSSSKKLSLGGLTVLLVISLSFFLANPIFAKSVLLDMDILLEGKVDGVTTEETRLTTSEIIGEKQTTIIQMPQKLRIEITPSLEGEGNQVRLVVKVFENTNGEYTLRGKPQVLTDNQQEASFKFGSDTSNIEMFITPSIQ